MKQKKSESVDISPSEQCHEENTVTNHVRENGVGGQPNGISSSSSDTSFANGDRPGYTQEAFDRQYSPQRRPTKAPKDRFNALKSKCVCTKKCTKKAVYKYMAFIDQLRNYNVKEDLLGDIMSGLTVGVMRIPQGMAYSLLASLPPVFGLYVSVIPVLVYALLGTSRHISIGTFAVVSLMVASSIEKAGCDSYATTNSSITLDSNSSMITDNITSGTTESMDAEVLKCKLGVATALCLMTGIINFAMGIFRLGFVTIYLSYPLTRGLTTGAAIHVFTSQIKYMFGIPVNKYSGPLNIIYLYIDFFRKIAMTNISALVMALVCIIFMVLIKELVNPKVKKLIKVPVPVELIVVIGGTLTSHYWGMEEKFGTDVVGPIPIGIPPPSLPPIDRLPQVVVDGVSLALVSFAINLSLCKLFAQSHNYKIDANVELVAYGIMNVVASFFNCFNSAGSLSRSLVQEGVGGKTQLASIVSSALMLIVIFVIGPLFQQLPKCVLAAIIIVNLKGMFLQFKDLKQLWIISIYDFLTWVVVFVAVLLLNVDLGMGVGIAFALLTVVFRTQRPYTSILGSVPGTDLFKNIDIYDAAKEIEQVKIFRFESSLYYANVEHFTEKLFSKTGINPRKVLAARKKKEKKQKAIEKKLEKQRKKEDNKSGGELKRRRVQPVGDPEIIVIELPDAATNKAEGSDTLSISYIIIDCTTMAYIDYMGVHTLGEIIGEYDKIGITVSLAGCKVVVREILEAGGFYNNISRDRLFVSVHDAVNRATINNDPPSVTLSSVEIATSTQL